MGISHSWNGTVLTITSDSGTSSADLKGDMGIRGPQGAPGISTGEGGTVDLTNYYTKEETNLEINNAISNLDIPEAEVDLSNYYTKQETAGIVEAEVETALTEAKESGVFDGKDGVNGKDGYTPVKGKDYFDGAQGSPGKDGADGKDGVSCTHSWSGTVLSITSSSGTSSADLKGAKGDTGASGKDGYTPVKGKDYFDGVKGDQGNPGKDGYTPVKGVDYWTTADKQEIISELETIVPSGVIAEANNTIDKALSREGSSILRFVAFADAHYKTDNDLIIKSNKELAQGIKEIANTIGIDFIVNLGDMTWAADADSKETVIEQAKQFNRNIAEAVKGEDQLWLEGNHETAKLTANEIQTLVYSHNKGITQDSAHWLEGYFYKDFDNIKVRVICLNTVQDATNIVGMNGTQLKWFAETALNMSGKQDWSVITFGHHPLGYNVVSLMIDGVSIIEAFVNKVNFTHTTKDNTNISIDYSNNNCKYIGHFHGHNHAYSVVRMQKYISSNNYKDINAYEICIPNACYTRNNQHLNNEYERIARYSTPTTYNKQDTDGKRTSFNLVTVCLDQNMIYADNYGVGVDREVFYNFAAIEPTYINQIPISTDTDGSIYGGDYNGDGVNDGYKTDTYLSGGNPSTRTGVETTGFIPFDNSGNYVIYMSGVTAKQTDSNFRIMLYNQSKTYHNQFASSNFTNNSYAPLVFDTDSAGNIIRIDMTAAVNAITDKNTSYFRMCAPEINGSSIITVNQEITD